jgi:DNA-binding MarR family transcriptional regulator
MRMLDPMSDASRIVERLIQKKLVERKTCKSDRRLVDVVITQKGLDLIEQTSSVIAAQEKIFHALTKTEAQDLNTLLDKLRAE